MVQQTIIKRLKRTSIAGGFYPWLSTTDVPLLMTKFGFLRIRYALPCELASAPSQELNASCKHSPHRVRLLQFSSELVDALKGLTHVMDRMGKKQASLRADGADDLAVW